MSRKGYFYNKILTLLAYNGAYLEDGNISDRLQPTAKNAEDVERLWKLSEELIGQKFDC